MPRIGVFVLFFSMSTLSQAKPLHCEILVNDDIVVEKNVESVAQEKIEIGDTQDVRGFVTEDEKQEFLIEGFLKSDEARLYARGIMPTGQGFLTASLWNRSRIVDIRCAGVLP